MRDKFFSFFKFIIGWPFSFLALLFIIKIVSQQFNSIKSHVFDIQPQFIIFGVLSFFAYYLLRCYLWQKILKFRGWDLPFIRVSYLWGFAELKRFVPGFIWSFIGRGVFFAQEGISQKEILPAIIQESQLIVLGSLILSCFSLPFVFYYFFPGLDFKIIPILITLTLLAGFCFIYQKKILNKINLSLHKKAHSLLISPLNPKENFILLIISFLSFFMLCLGGYFTVLSFVYLTPNLFLQIIGLFGLSYLLGYILVIFPMGLGVREGAITIGLSKLTTIAAAGFSSIIFRVNLILSEFIFLSSIFVFHRIKSENLSKFVIFLDKNKHILIAGLLCTIFAVYFSLASTLRYENFFTGRFDLGNADQVVWNTMRGRFFQMTDPNGTNIISRLANHADFFLVLLSPLYKLWADPRLLVIIQAFVVGFGGIFVYLIAKKLTQNKNISLAFTFVYLLNPSIENSVLYDFHSVVLATAFLLGAYYFFLKRKFLPFLIFCILSGITKEQIWLIVGLLSVLYAVKSKENKKVSYLSLALSFFSFLLCYLLIWKVIPSFKGGQHFALSYYSDFGDSPTTVIKGVFLSPLKTAGQLISAFKLQYVFKLFFPFGFLSVFSPLLLIFAAPDMGINLLSNNSQFQQINFQYTAAITPFLCIAAIYTVSQILKKKIASPFLINIFLLFFALWANYQLGPLPGDLYPNLDMITRPQPNKVLIDSFLNQIPKRLSIAASNNIGSHLSRRQRIYTIPVGIDKADVVLFLLNDNFAQPSLKSQKEMAQNLSKNKNYIEVFKTGDFVAFESKNLYLQNTRPRSNALFPLSIPILQKRDYSPSDITIDGKVESSTKFSSYILEYDSDGLSLHALYTIPNISKPPLGYPVLILDHGYIPPREYNTLSSYKGITDFFAGKGFIVLKPDYRGNAESEGDEDSTLRRFEYPADVMNLFASVPNIKDADTNSIYFFGHSMGGEITLKALEIIGKKPELAKKVKAAVLWAPVTDPAKWFAKSHALNLPEYASGSESLPKLYKILGTPEQNPNLWTTLSPLSYLKDIKTPIAIFHGTNDQTVPNEWSIELYNDLKSLNLPSDLTLYPGDDHNLSNSFTQAANKSLGYFENYKQN